MPDHWLYEFIDEFDVQGNDDVDRVFTTHKDALDLAVRSARRHAETDRYLPLEFGDRAIVAGTGLDLSPLDSCSYVNCMMGQAEEILSRVWHYFDVAVVEGLPAYAIIEAAKRDKLHAERLIRTFIPVLLQLRRQGMVDVLDFRDKPHAFCTNHYQRHAQDLGLVAALDEELARAAVDRIVDGARFEILRSDTHTTVGAFLSPALDLVPVMEWSPDEGEPNIRQIAEEVFAHGNVRAVGDLGLARELDVPLALPDRRAFRVESKRSKASAEATVALELQLPILQGLPVEEILKVRADMRPEFDRFRQALEAAIRDQVSRSGDASPKEIAERVHREFIEPALAELTVELQAARRTLARKATLDIGFGVAVASVGLLTGMPLAVGAGLAVVGATVSAAHAYVDQVREVELSDTYFLWQLSRHKHVT